MFRIEGPISPNPRTERVTVVRLARQLSDFNEAYDVFDLSCNESLHRHKRQRYDNIKEGVST